MAGLTRDKTDDPAIKVLAFDIETSQYFQVGEMQGRLDTWGLARKSEPDGLDGRSLALGGPTG